MLSKMKIFIFLNILFVWSSLTQTDAATTCNTTEVTDCKAFIDYIVSDVKTIDCMKKEIAEMEKENSRLKKQLACLSYSAPCDKFLVSDYGVTSGRLTASSEHNSNFAASLAYLNTTAKNGKGGSWAALHNNANQYLQIEWKSIRRVTGVATQGRSDHDQWVTKYRVLYSNDCKSWKKIGNGQVFVGNSDKNTIKKNVLPYPVKAKCIRINPTGWHSHVSMRADVIGCPLCSV